MRGYFSRQFTIRDGRLLGENRVTAIIRREKFRYLPVYLRPHRTLPVLRMSPSISVLAPSPATPTRIVIQGITTQGKAFRPSDWAERLCGVMSTFGGDQQMRYSPYVRPVMLDGVRCVVVEPSLVTKEPRAYRFLLDFAKDNELVVIDPNQAAHPVADDFCPIPGSALDLLASG